MSGRHPAVAERGTPLGAAEFAALMASLGPFEPAPRIAVAVSGGPDSMALALLAAAWARSRGGTATGLVVDHGLRHGSAEEAARTRAWLARHGIAARLLCWGGPKPATAIQAEARSARLTLLLEACRSEAVLHLLMGHQREDQAETVALRGAAGSGFLGLAGMAAVREVRGLRLLRPLLGLPKERLRATLTSAGQPWLVDPANASPQFARGRLRADPGFGIDAAWEQGARAAERRCIADDRAATLVARLARPDPLGLVRVCGRAWDDLAPAARALLLGRLVAAVGGRSYPAATVALRRLADSGIAASATVGGCIIVRRGADLVVCREAARIRHRLRLPSGACGLWDGRFLLRHEAGPATVEIRSLGPPGLRFLPRAALRSLRSARIPAPALHALPAAWVESELVACPPLHRIGLSLNPEYSIIAALEPQVPMAAARFAGVNVVSNPQQPIYRLATARELIDGSGSPVSPVESSRPTSRRTQ